LERGAPDPRARLRTVRSLAEAGISTQINCMPVMPGINDDEALLTPLFEAAREAGARHVIGQPLFLRPAARAQFFAWLDHERPQLGGLYRRLYARRDYLDDAARDRVLTTFRRLRLAAGFPRPLPARA